MIKKMIFAIGIILNIISIIAIIHIQRSSFNDPEGFYILTGKIVCTNTSSCWHEVGHSLDSKQAVISPFIWQWQSSQPEFQDTIVDLLKRCNTFPKEISLEDLEYCLFISNFPGTNYNSLVDGWGGYVELYASLLAFSNGKVGILPFSLQKFYNQKEINNIVINYNKDNYVTIN